MILEIDYCPLIEDFSSLKNVKIFTLGEVKLVCEMVKSLLRLYW